MHMPSFTTRWQWSHTACLAVRVHYPRAPPRIYMGVAEVIHSSNRIAALGPLAHCFEQQNGCGSRRV